jgi:Fur family peroxide stress response transcriptional regulator
MNANSARAAEFAEKLAARGYRMTYQRLCILEALLETETHPTAAEIFTRVRQSCPTTSLGTVYRTLETLKEMGEVVELQFREGSNRYDGVHTTAHAHIICTRCGHITDFDLDSLHAMEAQAAETSGYQVKTSRIEFYGLCRECQSSS